MGFVSFNALFYARLLHASSVSGRRSWPHGLSLILRGTRVERAVAPDLPEPWCSGLSMTLADRKDDVIRDNPARKERCI